MTHQGINTEKVSTTSNVEHVNGFPSEYSKPVHRNQEDWKIREGS